MLKLHADRITEPLSRIGPPKKELGPHFRMFFRCAIEKGLGCLLSFLDCANANHRP
jgi:hypothetical protein